MYVQVQITARRNTPLYENIFLTKSRQNVSNIWNAERDKRHIFNASSSSSLEKVTWHVCC